MKSSSIHIKVFFFIIIMVVCQCTSPRHSLVEYKQFHFNQLEEETKYLYNKGRLSNSLNVFYSINADTSWIHLEFISYKTETHDTSVDTLEYIYSTTLPGNNHDTAKIVKSYTIDGNKISTCHYQLRKGAWIMIGQQLYDVNGRLKENKWYDDFHELYFYDSQDRYVGYRHPPTEKDTVIYSEDGLSAIKISEIILLGDSTHMTNKKVLYELDRNGRIISQQEAELIDSITNQSLNNRTIYRYDKGGRVKKETSYNRNPNESLEKRYKTIIRYRHGLKRRVIRYQYDDGKWEKVGLTKFRNDYKNSLLLESVEYNSNGIIIQRRLWSYR